MKKLLLFFLFAITIVACKENKRASSNPSETQITFKNLDSIKSKQKNEIEEYLKTCDYNLLSDQPKSFQWKSKLNKDIIQFNGKGVFVFITYNLETYNKLASDLKKSKYKYSSKDMKNGLQVETYTKNKETIFLTSMINPADGKKIYSLTFLS